MAIKTVIKEVNSILDDIASSMRSGKMPHILGHSIVAQIDMGGKIAVESFKQGANFAFSALINPSTKTKWDKINNSKVWTASLRRVLTNLPTSLGGQNLQTMPARGIVPGPGVYILTRRNTQNPFLSIIICYTQGKKGAARATPDRIAKEFRDLIWKDWVNTSGIADQLPGSLFGAPTTRVRKAGTPRTLSDAQADWISGGSSGGAELAHTSQTTEGVLTLREIEEFQASVNLGYGLTTHDLTESVRNSMGIDYEEVNNKEGLGSFTFDSYVHMRFDKNFPGSEYTDLKNVRAEYKKEIRKQLAAAPFLNNARRELSKSPADKAIEDSIVEITKSFKTKKSATLSTTKKVIAKPFKKEPRRKTIKRPKSTTSASKVVSTLAVAGSGKRLRPQKEKADKQKSISSLKNQINKRLPAEVRRNMGRPALKNQTGDFSNSARLLELRNTSKGLSGSFTYTLTGGGRSKNRQGVYQTFENGQWPSGYNPKPLIAKSIRNLAMVYTKQKLVSLRRK